MAIIDESALTAAKIRDMPISAELRRVLLAAAHEAGVEIVRITSGGQPGSRGQRTGSNVTTAETPPISSLSRGGGRSISPVRVTSR
jgi:hypothetical protein